MNEYSLAFLKCAKRRGGSKVIVDSSWASSPCWNEVMDLFDMVLTMIWFKFALFTSIIYAS